MPGLDFQMLSNLIYYQINAIQAVSHGYGVFCNEWCPQVIALPVLLLLRWTDGELHEDLFYYAEREVGDRWIEVKCGSTSYKQITHDEQEQAQPTTLKSDSISLFLEPLLQSKLGTL